MAPLGATFSSKCAQDLRTNCNKLFLWTYVVTIGVSHEGLSLKSFQNRLFSLPGQALMPRPRAPRAPRRDKCQLCGKIILGGHLARHTQQEHSKKPGSNPTLENPVFSALPKAAFSTLPALPALPGLSTLPQFEALPALSLPALAPPPQSPALSGVSARSFGSASTMRSHASATTLGAADAMAMLVRTHDLVLRVSLADLLVAQWLCRVRSRSRDVAKPIAGVACGAMRQHYSPI